MITLRKAGQRGRTKLDWLDGRHSFSFGDYYDPEWMGFGPLRVINDDHVAPGKGFGTHPHKNMEIITYVLEGALAHKDSMGNVETIPAGDVQLMRAGTGVTHSEFNPSNDNPTHLLQIWIESNAKGLPPAYGQRSFAGAALNQWTLLASPDDAEGALKLEQDAKLYAADLKAGEKLDYTLAEGRMAYIHIATGDTVFNAQDLMAGDGAAVRAEPLLQIGAVKDSKILLFDLPQPL